MWKTHPAFWDCGKFSVSNLRPEASFVKCANSAPRLCTQDRCAAPTDRESTSSHSPRDRRTLQAWRNEFLAYCNTDRASNLLAEPINLLIEKIRRVGHGLPEFDHHRQLPLLHGGVTWHTPAALRIRSRRSRLVP